MDKKKILANEKYKRLMSFKSSEEQVAQKTYTILHLLRSCFMIKILVLHVLSGTINNWSFTVHAGNLKN